MGHQKAILGTKKVADEHIVEEKDGEACVK